MNDIIFFPFLISFITVVVATPLSLIFIKKLGIIKMQYLNYKTFKKE